MRLSSCLLSLLLHVGILFLGLYFPWQGASKPVDLGRPVYEVDLVQAPEPEAEPEEPAEVPEQEAQQEPAPEQEEPSPKQARKQAKAQPEQSQAQAKKLQKKSRAESKPAPEAKEKKQQPKKQEKKPQDQKKSQPQPSKDELLSRALGDIRQQAQEDQETDAEYLDRELAGLRSRTQERDSSSSGSSGSSRLEEIYALQIQRRIQDNWRYPSLGAEKELAAEVQIEINAQGKILNVNLLSSSGRSDFDSSVLRAVEDTEELPKPPRQDLCNIRITFHSQDLQG
ncbi:MAG: energy transducer TonB [Desulfohalobiaceae bacterium]